jgi:hypothetical protein
MSIGMPNKIIKPSFDNTLFVGVIFFIFDGAENPSPLGDGMNATRPTK